MQKIELGMNKDFMSSFKNLECGKKPGDPRCNISRYLARKGALFSHCHACKFHQKNLTPIETIRYSLISC